MELADIVQLVSTIGVNGVLAVVCWKLWGAYQSELAENRKLLNSLMDEKKHGESADGE